MRNTMEQVDSPFAMHGTSANLALAPTPFAMDPPPTSELTLEPAASGRPPHEAVRELGDLTARGDVRALLLRAGRGELLVHDDDVERCVGRVRARGFEIAPVAARPGDPRRTVGRHGVRLDLLVATNGGVRLDDEMLARSVRHVDDVVAVRMVGAEDLVVIEALENAEHRPHHWHDALGLIARRDLDWDYLAVRAKQFGPRRVLSLLLYAESEDLRVPTTVIEHLFDAVHPVRDRPRPGGATAG